VLFFTGVRKKGRNGDIPAQSIVCMHLLCRTALGFYLVISGFKLIFANTAGGANPIVGQFFERHVVVFCGIIDVTTDSANIFFHLLFLIMLNVVFFLGDGQAASDALLVFSFPQAV